MAKVLIIGGASGIGSATAKLFKSHHHEVVSVSRSTPFDYTHEAVVSDFF
jgi:NAD(P)-dependent dehydrogenase (short-subunit alcohol dehydrogenase family)